MTTIQNTAAVIRGLGLSVRWIGKTGEWRVNYMGGSENTAYYTDDSADAIATARQMALESQTRREDKAHAAEMAYLEYRGADY